MNGSYQSKHIHTELQSSHSSTRKTIRNELKEVIKSDNLVESAKILELFLSKGDPVDESIHRSQKHYVQVDFNVKLLLQNSAVNTSLDDVKSAMITSFTAMASGPVSLKTSTAIIILEKNKNKINKHISKLRNLIDLQQNQHE